jgi:oligopeptide/dipeptide ABC transporter ATP-binding protein
VRVVTTGEVARDPAHAEAVLVVKELTVEYGEGVGAVVAVKDVNMTIGRGEKRGVVGESGSGKTSLARAIPGLLGRSGRVVGGSIVVASTDLRALSERASAQVRRTAVSVVFQDPLNALDPVRSIYSQVAEAIRLRRPGGRHLRRPRMRSAIGALLEECEIADVARVMKQYPHELSGGMRQRVAIGMAIAGEATLIIADEPTTALDVVTQSEILHMLDRVVSQRSAALLFITHNLAVVSEFCDTVSVMYGGRIVEEGSCRDVVRQPVHPYSRGLIGAIPTIAGGRRELVGIPGDPPSLSDLERGCRFEPRCYLGHGVQVCCAQVPGLDDVPAMGSSRSVRCHLIDRSSGGGLGPAAA